VNDSKTSLKVLRFERSQSGKPHPEPRRSLLSASTEDERLTWPLRFLSVVGGLLFLAMGAGIMALLGREPSLELLVLLPLPLAITLFGIDLAGRGVLGRPWGRRVWKTASNWVTSRLRAPAIALIWIAILVVSGLVGWIRSGPEKLELALTLPAMLLHVFLHEFGHLGVARAVGYRPLALAVGPLFLRTDGPRPRLSLNRSWLQLFAGLAMYEPVGRTTERNLLVAAAGPLTNILLAVTALEIWGWPNPSSVLEIFLRSFIGLGFAIGIFNLLPLPRTTDGFALDGREILDHLRSLAR
jgi:Zn-dependent protease